MVFVILCARGCVWAVESARRGGGKEGKLCQSTATQASSSADETMGRMAMAGTGNEGRLSRLFAAFSRGKERTPAALTWRNEFVELGLWLRLAGWEVCAEKRKRVCGRGGLRFVADLW